VALAEAASVASFVRFLEPRLSECIGAAAAGAIAARARSLPLDVQRELGFELPLARSGGQVDLSLRIAPAVALRRLARFGGEDRELAELLRLLASEDELVAKSANWLEYDIGTDAAPQPSLFARPSGERSAVPLAQAVGAPEPGRRSLQRLVDALGPEGRVAYVAVMRRAEHELRALLVSQDGEPAQVLDALERCGWPGDRSAVEDVFTRYGPLAARWALGIGFDRDGAFLERTGIELHLGPAAEAEQMLTRLEADALAVAGTWSRLMSWDGYRIDPSGDSAPEALRAVAALSGGRVVTAVRRRIHHVKVTIDPGAVLTAKAYLSAGHVLGTPP
jgi:hypothetical protein